VSDIQFSVEFPLLVVIYPASDIKGQWIAHCLETDVVTQGDSTDHAFEMMAETLESISKFNLSHGRFPVALTPAPIARVSPVFHFAFFHTAS